tara:strand:- start:466 stop:765 length:300 start_codon:yes stop_codon:yes gene_type:complete
MPSGTINGVTVAIGHGDLVAFLPCSHCGQEEYVKAKHEDVQRYLRGALVQEVWPNATPVYREQMIGLRNGGNHYLCGTCWDDLFRDDEDETSDLGGQDE